MKHLFIVHDFPPILGGQATYLYSLCRCLPQNRFVVLAPQIKGAALFDQQQNFKIVRRDMLLTNRFFRNVAKIVMPFIWTFSLMKKEKIKKIHCAHVLSTGFVGLCFKIFKNIPYGLYIHGADVLEFSCYAPIKKLLLMILSQAQTIVVNSDYTRSILLNWNVDSKKIYRIYPRIDDELFRQPLALDVLKEKYRLQDKKIVLSVNRLVERKGNDTVIKAFQLVQKEFPDAQYVVIGEGPCRSYLERLAHDCKVKVVFLNHLEETELVSFYQLCDVFVMASRAIVSKGDVEGFGIGFLEANAAGKPVVGGNSGGVNEAVIHNQTGILVDPVNVKEMASAIVRLLKDPVHARQLGQQGQDRVRKQFSCHQGIPELEKILQ